MLHAHKRKIIHTRFNLWLSKYLANRMLSHQSSELLQVTYINKSLHTVIFYISGVLLSSITAIFSINTGIAEKPWVD